MEHLWWLFAFAAGFTTALYLSFNQYVKMPPALLMVYRGLLLSLFLLPFLFYFKPVPNMLFYILCVVQGSLVAYMDNRFFAISRQYGAEVSGTIQPFSLMPVFMSLPPSRILCHTVGIIRYYISDNRKPITLWGKTVS